MTGNEESKKNTNGGGVWAFLGSFFTGLARDFFVLVFSFAVGTGGAAIVCWYYGLPLALSILGGILVLGFALALTTDSFFD